MPSKMPGGKQTNDAAPKRRAALPSKSRVATLEQTDSIALQHAAANLGAALPHDILALQRLAGNRAVSGLIQAKLMVGPAGDRYEQEADRVAEQVMTSQVAGMPANRQSVQRQEEAEAQTSAMQRQPLAASITPLIRRQAGEEEEVQTAPLLQPSSVPPALAGPSLEKENVQTKPLIQRQGSGSFAAGHEFENKLSQSQGSGKSLPAHVRAEFEPKFGADFSGVRVHTGARSAELNRDIQAKAFTHGQDIFMGDGQYNPGSAAGKRLLAHELTHTIQQTGKTQASLIQRVITSPTSTLTTPHPQNGEFATPRPGKLVHLHKFTQSSDNKYHVATGRIPVPIVHKIKGKKYAPEAVERSIPLTETVDKTGKWRLGQHPTETNQWGFVKLSDVIVIKGQPVNPSGLKEEGKEVYEHISGGLDITSSVVESIGGVGEFGEETVGSTSEGLGELAKALGTEKTEKNKFGETESEEHEGLSTASGGLEIVGSVLGGIGGGIEVGTGFIGMVSGLVNAIGHGTDKKWADLAEDLGGITTSVGGMISGATKGVLSVGSIITQGISMAQDENLAKGGELAKNILGFVGEGLGVVKSGIDFVAGNVKTTWKGLKAIYSFLNGTLTADEVLEVITASLETAKAGVSAIGGTIKTVTQILSTFNAISNVAAGVMGIVTAAISLVTTAIEIIMNAVELIKQSIKLFAAGITVIKLNRDKEFANTKKNLPAILQSTGIGKKERTSWILKRKKQDTRAIAEAAAGKETHFANVKQEVDTKKNSKATKELEKTNQTTLVNTKRNLMNQKKQAKIDKENQVNEKKNQLTQTETTASTKQSSVTDQQQEIKKLKNETGEQEQETSKEEKEITEQENTHALEMQKIETQEKLISAIESSKEHRGRFRELDKTKKSLRHRRIQLHRKKVGLDNRRADLSKRKVKLQKQKEKLAELENSLQEGQTALNTSRELIKQHRESLTLLETNLLQRKNDLTQAETEFNQANDDLNRITGEVQNLELEIQQKEKTLSEFNSLKAYLTVHELEKINVKRIKRTVGPLLEEDNRLNANLFSVGASLTSIGFTIGGLASSPTGVGAGVGAGGAMAANIIGGVVSGTLKAISAVSSAGRSTFRWGKQQGRNIAGKFTKLGLGTIFDTRKTSEAKKKKRATDAVQLLKMVADLPKYDDRPETKDKYKQMKLYLKATGVSLNKLYKLNGKPKEQAELLMEAMKKRD